MLVILLAVVASEWCRVLGDFVPFCDCVAFWPQNLAPAPMCDDNVIWTWSLVKPLTPQRSGPRRRRAARPSPKCNFGKVSFECPPDSVA